METTTSKGEHRSHFDHYADDYDGALNEGLSLTGEGKDYFARERIRWLSRCLKPSAKPFPQVMDYGCGTGSSTEFLIELLNPSRIVGVDCSSRSLEIARQAHHDARCEFLPTSSHTPNGQFDLVYCNGVFHHIAPPERAAEMKYIFDSLRPAGWFALWENNPWNPGTRYVMSRIPFDRDAVVLTASLARALARNSGFEVLRTDFLFLFPKALKSLRWLEPFFSKFPVGGQYQVLCRKPG